MVSKGSPVSSSSPSAYAIAPRTPKLSRPITLRSIRKRSSKPSIDTFDMFSDWNTKNPSTGSKQPNWRYAVGQCPLPAEAMKSSYSVENTVNDISAFSDKNRNPTSTPSLVSEVRSGAEMVLYPPKKFVKPKLTSSNGGALNPSLYLPNAERDSVIWIRAPNFNVSSDSS